MAFDGFDPKWKDFPDFIIGITGEIREDRGIATLNRYYADRAASGFARHIEPRLTSPACRHSFHTCRFRCVA